MQFTAPAPVAIPTDAYGLISDGTTAIMMGTVDSTISTCPRGVGGCTTVARSPVVHVAHLSGGFTTVQVDDITTYPLPSGFRQPNNGLTGQSNRQGRGWVCHGRQRQRVGFRSLPRGCVPVAVCGSHRMPLHGSASIYVTSSADTNMFMRDVVATDSGFVAVGEMTGPVNLSSPSTGLVLTSPDGINWTKGPDLALPWSVTLQRVVAHGNQVLLRGTGVRVHRRLQRDERLLRWAVKTGCGAPPTGE